MVGYSLGYVAGAASQPLSVQCSAACIIGLLAHGLYFIHWADDRNAMTVLVVHLFALLLLLPLEVVSWGVLLGLRASFLVFTTYLGTLFTSIFIYRLFFHHLRRFPGPFWAKITKGYGIYANRDGKMHEEYDRLLHKYGPFVRIGPDEILHTAIDAVTEVHGLHSKCVKGNFYSAMEYGEHRVPNLDAIVDKAEHRSRRQVWDKAFNGKAIEAREQPIRDVICEWLAKVDELNGKPVNWTLFASLISFDITGRVGFSTDFGGVRASTKSIFQRYIQSLFRMMADVGHQPWIISLSKRSLLPDSSDVVGFEDFARKLIAQRLKDTEPKEDIVHYFIEDFKSEKPKAFLTMDHLETDAQAILIGAADSSYSPITFCFRHLILNPGTIDRLRIELAPLFNRSQKNGFANADLARSTPFLDAVIHETMRLHNPTCTSATKRTPPEGLFLDGIHIPGNVDLISSIWSFHRSERYFVRPQDWIPERWTTQPELVLDKRAYHPFSVGESRSFFCLFFVK
ncbi:hypothetical protein QQZ08_003962 [Neonectria magnoliae]|uniref:Cytochrome P450 n=1 Tax=Neonectria magnoliae TaxID=2732573 RepID=A0ABR1I7P2_9HYPO